VLRLFAGKGGVGKTTCAAATAVREAEAGRDVLVVSTDPAHSLGDALDVELGPEPHVIPVRSGRLRAMELDADAALDRWIDERRDVLREIASRGTYLDEDDLDRFFQLSLPGVDELIGLVELDRVSADLGAELVVVDTAPTGHLVRMLAMPGTLRQIAGVLDDMQEKHRVIAGALTGADPESDRADAFVAEIEDDAARVRAMLTERTSASWVCLPQALSVAETHDGLRALREIGVPVAEVIVNRVTTAPPRPCALCDGRRAAEERAIAGLPTELGRVYVPRADAEPRGVAALRPIGRALARGAPPPRGTDRAPRLAPTRGDAHLEAWPELRIVLFGGKGGVGKTTCAAAAALQLAERHPDRRILVLSTDPAHSLGDVLGLELGDEPRRVSGSLWARELDARAELDRRRADYGRAVDDLFDALRGGSRLDATYDRAIVRDLIDLAPPGIDEVFAAIALLESLGELGGPSPQPPPASREGEKKRFDLVVVDTAPWGHTERLLELPETAREWVKTLLAILLKYKDAIGLGSLAEDLVALSRALGRLVETWRDPERTVFVPVTRAAALPRLETERLLASLRRLGMRVPAMIVNATRDPSWRLCRRCERARSAERREIGALRKVGPLVAVAPVLAEPPIGADALQAWARSWKVLPRSPR
jgi:arsenite-transporting ATPase